MSFSSRIYARFSVPCPPDIGSTPNPSSTTTPGDANTSEGTVQSGIFDPAYAYVTSPFIRPLLLFAGARLLVGVYAATTLLVNLIWQVVITRDANSYFSFFTYLSYIGLCAYFFASGTQTLCYALRARHVYGLRARSESAPQLDRNLKAGTTVNEGGVEKADVERMAFSELSLGEIRGREEHIGHLRLDLGYPLQRWPRPLQVLHVVLHATVVSFPLVVTIVFWSLLSDASTFSSTFNVWSNVSIHAMNSVFALADVLLSNVPAPPWAALPITLFLLVLYLGVAYISHAVLGVYPYPFLDPELQHGRLAAYIVGIAFLQAVVFAAVRVTMLYRQRWVDRR